MNVWLLVPAVLLALGVGVLVGRAGDDDGTSTAADKPTKVLGESITRDETTTTTVEETTTTTEAEVTTTTTTAAATVAPATTTTTTRATTATTATPATTAPPATTTTTSNAAVAGCGTGTAGAGANLVVTGSGPPSNPTFTYSGPATVTNNTSKAIEITSLVLRLTSSDGTSENVAVPGAVGTVVQPGATAEFSFTHTTAHPPKENGTGIASFAYKPPGGTKNCAST